VHEKRTSISEKRPVTPKLLPLLTRLLPSWRPAYTVKAIDVSVSRAGQGCATVHHNVVAEAEPTVFHITHWKAGSQWIHRILHLLCFDRLVLPDSHGTQFLKRPIHPKRVYPTLYITKEQFDSVSIPADHRRFVMIRDLRDTLISFYFSVKISHAYTEDMSEELSIRNALLNSNFESGFLKIMERYGPPVATIQESWNRAGEPLLRYEDLLKNDLKIMERVLLKQCDLRVTSERLREVVLASRFEKVTGGRPRGREDIAAHERKGVSGDWRNYSLIA